VLPVFVIQALQLWDTNVTGNTAVISGGGLLLGAVTLFEFASHAIGMMHMLFCACNG
jgi:hypothetical protein